MNRSKIRLRFANGLRFEEFVNDVLWVVRDIFDFIEHSDAEFLVFGPYGPPPPPGAYTRIGYFCENIEPNMDICDWGFGVPYEEDVHHPRYCRIEWHAIKPTDLIKSPEVAKQPTPKQFCNFVNSNPAEFRESFFRALNRFKRVDAPGKSMNNRPSFDLDYPHLDQWQRKRRFLSGYKFTIAFENQSMRGYNTEKLTDPMLVGSIPIYWGNPCIGRHFNTRSFINAHEYLPSRRNFVTRWLEAKSIVPYGRGETRPGRLAPRLRKLMRAMKQRFEFGFNFDRLVARIRQIDGDEEAYREMLQEPWLLNNTAPSIDFLRGRWSAIFGEKAQLHSCAKTLDVTTNK